MKENSFWNFVFSTVIKDKMLYSSSGDQLLVLDCI